MRVTHAIVTSLLTLVLLAVGATAETKRAMSPESAIDAQVPVDTDAAVTTMDDETYDVSNPTIKSMALPAHVSIVTQDAPTPIPTQQPASALLSSMPALTRGSTPDPTVNPTHTPEPATQPMPDPTHVPSQQPTPIPMQQPTPTSAPPDSWVIALALMLLGNVAALSLALIRVLGDVKKLKGRSLRP